MRILPALLCLTMYAVAAAPAFAGGGPETTLVVVNDDSPLSQEVANRYVELRGIHPTHVCRLRGIPNLTVIGIETFRERILDPIRAYLKTHELEDEIDVIAYSADFPFGVNYDGDFKGEELPQGIHKFRVGSLTGLTYLHHLVDKRDQGYLDLRGGANRYARVVPRGTSMDVLGAHGYRREYRWSGEARPEVGEDAEGDGGYFLCTMLGATGIQGNTAAEVLACLDSAAASDGTAPQGTVYLMDHKDIRAKTRRGFFEKTAEMLQALDRPCVVLTQGEAGQDGKVPVGKEDVVGCVAGIAGFNWPKSGSRLLPGSIVEHLTSFGARLDGSGQTKCTEFIRAGAAGTSGAVAEPYALWMKFPLPFLHAHYAAGCSLSEAFYQNVFAPYQLLVLGDPLARPFATLATVTLDGPKVDSPWSGTVSLKAAVERDGDAPTGAVEFWLDGQRIASGPPERAFELDTTTVEDGGHTLRVVAVEGTDVETRSSVVLPIVIDNDTRRVTVTVPRKPAPLDEREIVFKGLAKGAEEVELLLGATSLGTAKVKSSRWRLEVAASRLGIGTHTLVARATYRDAPAVRSELETFEIVPPDVLEPEKPKRRSRRPRKKGGDDEGDARPAPGLAALVVDKNGKEHAFPVTFLGRQGKQHFAQQVGAKAPGGAKRITLSGEVKIDGPGLHRLAINAAGDLTIRINGTPVFEGEGLVMDRQAYAAVALEAGWHPIEIDYAPAAVADLWVMLGGAQVSAFLDQAHLRHAP